jgi:hypothetical protein
MHSQVNRRGPDLVCSYQLASIEQYVEQFSTADLLDVLRFALQKSTYETRQRVLDVLRVQRRRGGRR